MYQFGKTTLIHAVDEGHLALVEYLVEKGADLEARDTVSNVISWICNHKYVTHEYTPQYGYTPLMWAARYGRLPVVEYLVEKGADPNAQDNVSEQ